MIDFLKYRWITTVISLSIIGGFLGTSIYKIMNNQEPLKFSVDFTGGTQVLFKFSKSTTSSELLSILEKAGWSGAQARQFSENEVLIRVKETASDATGLATKMKDALSLEMPGVDVQILQNESVGQTIGADLRWKATLAILLALLAMLIYIVLRFRSFSFALGAVIALFHDAIAILAVFMVFGLEISPNVIMAILAILGYSINDTIVIFTQIRKNLRKMHNSSIYDIVNTSINQMLRRTLLTSISTGLTVTALLIIGGETLRNLSIALLVGIIFGTDSSIYIASMIMVFFYRKKNTETAKA